MLRNGMMLGKQRGPRASACQREESAQSGRAEQTAKTLPGYLLQSCSKCAFNSAVPALPVATD